MVTSIWQHFVSYIIVVRACVRAWEYECACVRACVRACVYVCVCVCVVIIVAVVVVVLI